MPDSSPTTLIPNGLPTYTGRHDEFVWPQAYGPRVLLHDDFDLLLVRAGTASLILPGGQRLLARRGEMLLLPPLVAATINQAAGGLVFWYCHFDFRATPRSETREWLVPIKIAGRAVAPIARAYAALHAIAPDQPLAAWQRESALINLIAALINAHAPHRSRSAARTVVSPIRDARVITLQQKIEADPAAPWRVRQMAQSLDVSPGHLHATWVKALGCAPKTYIVRARLRKAMSLLRPAADGNRQSIKQVAARCGFSSQHLFSRQFHKAFGITPTMFRNSAGL